MDEARELLDQAVSLSRIAEIEADPARYARAVAVALPIVAYDQPLAVVITDHEARDHELAVALAHIDTAIARIMRTRLEHALASDTSVAAPTRNVFASTVGKYANDLPLLAERVRDVAARGGSHDPDTTATRVVDTARATLALREALRAPVLDLVRELATAARPAIQRLATDRRKDDAERTRWSGLRRDVDTVIARPEHVTSAPLSTRLAALPAELDELPAEPEVSFADMIEID